MARRIAPASVEQPERLSKDDWIRAALHEAGECGVAQIRIDALASALGVTKGSFYWHFKDRDALLREMLHFWQLRLTSAIGEFVRTRIESPRDRLAYLLGAASEDRDDVPGGIIEHALREWARSSELARRAISEVDDERLAIIARIYHEMGMSRPRAATASLLALSHVIGVNVIHRDVGLQKFRAQREVCLELLISLPEWMQ